MVLFIKKFKVTIDEDIFMRLSQLQDGCPILEDAVFYTDLRFGIDLCVAWVLLLPWFSSGESSIFGITPLKRNEPRTRCFFYSALPAWEF